MTGSGARDRSFPAAGLFAGALAWFVNTEANYALAGRLCGWDAPVVPLVSAAALIIALGGGMLSWRALRLTVAPPEARGGSPDRLLAGAGVIAAALFAAVILIQGAAGLVFDGCER
jgi:hypothetical protein